MKSSVRLLVACAVALLVASCASPLERRVTRNPELWGKLSETEKGAVKDGRIKEGMSMDAVFFLAGRPSQVSEGTRDGKKFVRWSYTDYTTVIMDDFGYGWGRGRYRHGYYCDPFFYGGPTIASVPVQGMSVEFVNGKVTGYLVPRR